MKGFRIRNVLYGTAVAGIVVAVGAVAFWPTEKEMGSPSPRLFGNAWVSVDRQPEFRAKVTNVHINEVEYLEMDGTKHTVQMLPVTIEWDNKEGGK